MKRQIKNFSVIHETNKAYLIQALTTLYPVHGGEITDIIVQSYIPKSASSVIEDKVYVEPWLIEKIKNNIIEEYNRYSGINVYGVYIDVEYIKSGGIPSKGNYYGMYGEQDPYDIGIEAFY